LLKIHYQSFKTYFSYKDGKRWQFVYASSVGVMLLDLLIQPWCCLRFSRFLRPVVSLVRTRALRRFYTVVLDVMPSTPKLAAPMFWFVVMYAIIFQRTHREDSGGAQTGSAGASVEEGEQGFGSTLQSVYTFSVLLFTLDNYHEVEDSMRQRGGGGEGSVASFDVLRVVAFYVFLVIGCIFLLSLVLGVTYEAYDSRTKRQVKSEHVKELQGLTKAFSIVDVHHTGFLTRKQWSLLLCKLRPKYTAYKIFLLYDICSGFSTKLDFIHFYNLRNVLNHDILHQAKEDVTAIAREKEFMTRICAPLAWVGELSYYTYFTRALLYVDYLSFVLDAERYKITQDLFPSSIGAGLDNSLHSLTGISISSCTVCDAIGLLVLVDLLVRICREGGINAYRNEKYTKQVPRHAASRRADFNCVLLSTALTCLSHVFTSSAARKFAVQCSIIRLLRLPLYNKILWAFGCCFLSIGNAVLETIIFVAVILYAFACVAMELLGTALPHRFGTFGDSMRQLLALLFNVDFHERVTECVEAALSSAACSAPLNNSSNHTSQCDPSSGSNCSPSVGGGGGEAEWPSNGTGAGVGTWTCWAYLTRVRLFFLSFYIVVVLVIMNLVASRMLQFYEHAFGDHSFTDLFDVATDGTTDRDTDASVLSDKEKKILEDKMQMATVLGMFEFTKEDKLTFQYNKNASSANIREELALGKQLGKGHGNLVSKEELHACLKYTSLDLLGMYDSITADKRRRGSFGMQLNS
jgi:hypothetical protein